MQIAIIPHHNFKQLFEALFKNDAWTGFVLCLVAQLCLTLCNPMNCSLPGSGIYKDTPGKNTGVGCHALFQRIFPTQGSNPSLPHCRQILYHLNHQGSPRTLEWVGYPFFRWSSWSRNWTEVSCIGGGFSTSWATGKHLRKDKCMPSSCPIFRCSMEISMNCIWTDFWTMLWIHCLNNHTNNNYVTKPRTQREVQHNSYHTESKYTILKIKKVRLQLHCDRMDNANICKLPGKSVWKYFMVRIYLFF